MAARGVGKLLTLARPVAVALVEAMLVADRAVVAILVVVRADRLCLAATLVRIPEVVLPTLGVVATLVAAKLVVAMPVAAMPVAAKLVAVAVARVLVVAMVALFLLLELPLAKPVPLEDRHKVEAVLQAEGRQQEAELAEAIWLNLQAQEA